MESKAAAVQCGIIPLYYCPSANYDLQLNSCFHILKKLLLKTPYKKLSYFSGIPLPYSTKPAESVPDHSLKRQDLSVSINQLTS